MARLLKQADAKLLNLPGRLSREAVCGGIGSRMTFRVVEIAVPRPGEKSRGPHLHRDFEECIYVLSGQGTMHAESGQYPAGPGNILLVPPGEKHMTVNTGREPLVLLCFFPVPDVAAGTTEFASF
jgi:mannose-6-phosphate isomerase-like protein (cupin superfamily)